MNALWQSELVGTVALTIPSLEERLLLLGGLPTPWVPEKRVGLESGKGVHHWDITAYHWDITASVMKTWKYISKSPQVASLLAQLLQIPDVARSMSAAALKSVSDTLGEIVDPVSFIFSFVKGNSRNPSCLSNRSNRELQALWCAPKYRCTVWSRAESAVVLFPQLLNKKASHFWDGQSHRLLASCPMQEEVFIEKTPRCVSICSCSSTPEHWA